MSDPETISWPDALRRIIETGHVEDAARAMLVEAVRSNTVHYYPQKALPFNAGLFDSRTGAWPLHNRDDKPFFVRLVRSEFEAWLSKTRRPSKAGSETKAIEFLRDMLRDNENLTRSAAWSACHNEFRNLSKRRFTCQVWPQARVKAGLPPRASAGRKKKKP